MDRKCITRYKKKRSEIEKKRERGKNTREEIEEPATIEETAGFRLATVNTAKYGTGG